jgi:surface protein
MRNSAAIILSHRTIMTYRLAPHHGLALIATLLLASQAAAQTYVYRTTADNSPFFAPGADGGEAAGPDAAPTAECYAPENIGQVAPAGWSGCGGMLIVSKAMLDAVASVWTGGDNSFAIIGPDGNTYSFEDSEFNVFTGQVTSMAYLFRQTSYNGDISYWDTSRVTNMNSMFFSATGFNQPIGSWDTSKVTIMSSMFRNALTYNQDIGGWDTSAIPTSVGMDSMFRGAAAFSQDLSGWCVTNAPTPPDNFDLSSGFAGQTALQPQWGTCPGA